MKYGCIGEHLGHSFSGIIHRRIGRYEYALQELAPAELGPFLERRDFCGVNVTIPYKREIIPYLDSLSERARSVGAVNTIVNRGGKLYGDNTDLGGMQALIARMGLDLNGQKVLILGTGGTSLTAMAVARSLGAAEIYRVSRQAKDGAVTYDEACERHGDSGIIINTTPCGMFPEVGRQPIDPALFPHLIGVVDAIYNPLRSCLVLSARQRGLKAEGGLYMLVAQAVLAAEIFTGQPLPEDETDLIYDRLLAEKENLVLIGMPGSGKTTVGGLLSRKLGRELLDLDELIAKKAGRSVSRIFAEHGEAAFRRLETQAIAEVSAKSGLVVATGGGAVLRQENLRALAMNGRLFFLDRPLSQLLPTEDRPLARDSQQIRRLYEERYPIYRQAADEIIKAEGPPESVAETIMRSLA